MKGSAAGVGMFPISEFMHGLEDVLDAVRQGSLVLSPAILGVLLEGVDHGRGLVRAVRDDAPPADLTEYRGRLEAALLDVDDTMLAGDGVAAATSPASDLGLHLLPALPRGGEADARAALADGAHLYGVRFMPALDTYQRGLDPLALLRSLAEDAQILSSRALVDDLPSLADLDPFECRVGHALVVATSASREELETVFEFGPEGSLVEVLELDPDSLEPSDPPESALRAGGSGWRMRFQRLWRDDDGLNVTQTGRDDPRRTVAGDGADVTAEDVGRGGGDHDGQLRRDAADGGIFEPQRAVVRDAVAGRAEVDADTRDAFAFGRVETGEVAGPHLHFRHRDERERQLLSRRYELGWSIKRIADEFGLSPGAVATSLYRIRNELLLCIEKNLDGRGRR